MPIQISIVQDSHFRAALRSIFENARAQNLLGTEALPAFFEQQNLLLNLHFRADSDRAIEGIFKIETQQAATKIHQIETLTGREREVLELLTRGFSYKMTAAQLHVTIETVRTHVKRIYQKLQVHSLAEATAKLFFQYPASGVSHDLGIADTGK